MPTISSIAPLAAAAFLIVGTAAAQATADTTIRFPRVEGSNLEKRAFALPDGFEGELNVVFVAFRREQQADVDTWTPFVRDQRLDARGVKHYELPTLNRSYKMVRPFIDGGMARGIPDKGVREATITLYIDKAPFKRALGITTEDRIVVFLVGRDGRVRWRGDGPYTPALGAQLAAMLPAPREITP